MANKMIFRKEYFIFSFSLPIRFIVLLIFFIYTGIGYGQTDKFDNNKIDAVSGNNSVGEGDYEFDCLPKVWITDIEGDRTKYVNFALWDFLTDNQGIDIDFNTYDNDQFFVKVQVPGLPSSTTELEANLRSVDKTGTQLDFINNVTLTRIGTSSDFQSQPILLVMEDNIVDDNFGIEDCSSTNSSWDGIDGTSNDKTIHGVLGGKLEAIFNNGVPYSVNICEPNKIKKVTINAFIMEVNGEPLVNLDFVQNQLEIANTLLQQACIELDYNITNIEVNENVDLMDGLSFSDVSETLEMNNLISPIKALTPPGPNSNKKIDVIFINFFTQTGPATRGLALRDETTISPFWEEEHARTVIIAGDHADYFTTGHEITHILTNRGHFGPVGVGDYSSGPDTPISNQLANAIQFNNLMKSGTAPCNGVFETKRLWFFQAVWARTNTNIPQ